MSIDDPKVQNVIEAGRKRGIKVRPRFFSAGTRTAQDAAREVGCEVAQIVKTLVFMAGNEPLLFLVSGSNRLDETRAAAAARVSKLDKANAHAAKAATGYSIGATPPFGHSSILRMFMDIDLLKHDEVWAAGGRPDSVFPVSPVSLQMATGAVVAKLGVATAT